METTATVRAQHHHRWDIAAYRQGWNDTDHIIAQDYPVVDAPTVRVFASEQIKAANRSPERSPNFYRYLGAAARWLATLAS